MEDKNAKKCWYCAKLGKCNALKPCKEFVEFKYVRTSDCSLNQIASLFGVTRLTVSKWLKKDKAKTLTKIKKKTGLILDYVITTNGIYKLIEI